MTGVAQRPSLSPLLWYRDPKAALAFLEAAFGFETRLLVDDGQGGVMHSETAFGDGVLMVVGPPRPGVASPLDLGGVTSASVHVQVREGLDALCERARAAGARIEREPEDQPYGDRVFTCLDPEGHPWSFGQTVQTLTLA
ncbi:VOC family protein [Caulobacter sp. KR2-114]|uniref:VOC family protein n=1 Tax=Caulobacter sp. KR2-114 TaxID=3400912 RepID=UPI003C03F6A0